MVPLKALNENVCDWTWKTQTGVGNSCARYAGLERTYAPTARQILKHVQYYPGIALAENAYDETAIIRAILPDQIEAEEMKILDWARNNMPRLPLHILIFCSLMKPAKRFPAQAWIQHYRTTQNLWRA
jgi:hypothetical protein